MIDYSFSADGVAASQLEGFFVGWPNPPSPETLLRILKQSSEIVLATDTETGRVVGFVNAISDGVLAAYLPLLEVLPDYQHRGIGSELVEKILDRLAGFYMIDLLCDEDLEPFYTRFGMRRMGAMALRNYDAQTGKQA